jgi:hypothetical protein
MVLRNPKCVCDKGDKFVAYLNSPDIADPTLEQEGWHFLEK